MAARGGFITGGGRYGPRRGHHHRNRIRCAGTTSTVFDARLSDYIDETISGLKLKIRFLRVNERHHSVAIAAVNRMRLNPIRTRVQHVNIQVADLDDMAEAYRRVKELGFRMALGVGQHTNDKELSFYADHARRDSNGNLAGIRSLSTRRPGNQPLIRASASGVTRRRGRRSSRSSPSSRLRPHRCYTARTSFRRSPVRVSQTAEHNHARSDDVADRHPPSRHPIVLPRLVAQRRR